METVTVTLADFLLARIAEDEAMAERLRSGSIGDPWGWQPFNYQLEWCDKRRIDYPPARVLAECEAKRRIVDIANAQIGLGRQARGWDNWEDMATQTLHALAAPYADHPDYNPDWRP